MQPHSRRGPRAGADKKGGPVSPLDYVKPTTEWDPTQLIVALALLSLPQLLFLVVWIPRPFRPFDVAYLMFRYFWALRAMAMAAAIATLYFAIEARPFRRLNRWANLALAFSIVLLLACIFVIFRYLVHLAEINGP